MVQETFNTAVREKYDALCKEILSRKIYLAWILKGCVEGFENCTPEEIAGKYIIGTPQVAEMPVMPEEATYIDTVGVENSSKTEGKITYDIRFRVRQPKTEGYIGLIINVEAQDSFNPGYPLTKRGIYYGSRLISAQKNVDFMKSHYENIKKVCSIWVCTNPPKNRRNTITEYGITECNIVGKVREPKENYDLMSVVMVCLGDFEEACENELLRLLSVILGPQIDTKQRKAILQNEFQIQMTEDMEEEADRMCNLSEGIWRKGVQEGREEGREEGRLSLLITMIQPKLDRGMTVEEIARDLELTIDEIKNVCERMKEIKKEMR